MDPQHPTAIELRVELLGIEPVIWRRLLVPWPFHLGQLHRVIQAAFGWWDCHLHGFQVGGLRYGDPEQIEDMSADDVRSFDETGVRLLDFRAAEPVNFLYIYDFGDNWEHRLTYERFVATSPAPRTASCLAGERVRPPEDVGGIGGYENFLEIIADPEHPEHADMRRWAGGRFDPERFDLARTDRDVRAALRPSRPVRRRQ